MKQMAISMIALVLSLTMGSSLMAQGVWTPLTNPNPSGASGVQMLLSDGSVIVCNSALVNINTGNATLSNVWTKLTPDSSGNYVNGTWSYIAPMNVTRRDFASNVLPSGKVFVMGGEYTVLTDNPSFANSGEIYDPVANKWTNIATFPLSAFGDDPSVVLNNGKILCGYIGDGTVGGATDGFTYLYDPAANSWTQTGTKLLKDQSDEETWTLLPDGSVLSFNVFASPATGAGSAQRYIPSSGTWLATGPVPVPLSNVTLNNGTNGGLGAELGPMLLLPDGRVFLVGANNNTVLYSPSTNTWTQGPSLPTNFGCDDAPGAMLPNGNVLFFADMSLPKNITPPTKAFLFNPAANSITDVTPTGTLGNIMASNIAQQHIMLMLPNGHLLLSTGGATLWDYAPTGTPSTSWAPTIKNISKVSGNTYTLTGTQLNGISEGSSYGDDAENSTNYPIVRLKSATNVVTYARTSNWSPGLVASGSLVTSVTVTLPSGLANGIYQLSVIANGISSASQNFTINNVTPSNVIATYSSGTLTLTGDAGANSLTVSLQAGVLLVQGANGTTINSTTSFSHTHSGPLVINASLSDGNDAVSVIGVSSSATNISLGNGNDQAAFTLCNITTLTIDGGPGTDTLLTTSTKITTLHETNIP